MKILGGKFLVTLDLFIVDIRNLNFWILLSECWELLGDLPYVEFFGYLVAQRRRIYHVSVSAFKVILLFSQ